MNKKLITILLALLVLVSLGLIITLFPTRSNLDYQTFVDHSALIIANLPSMTSLEVRTYAPHLTSQPFNIRLQASLSKITGRPFAMLGTPEEETHTLIETKEKQRIKIILRRTGHSINRIVVTSDATASSTAKTLHAALTKAFSNMTVDLEPSQNAPPQKP